MFSITCNKQSRFEDFVNEKKEKNIRVRWTRKTFITYLFKSKGAECHFDLEKLIRQHTSIKKKTTSKQISFFQPRVLNDYHFNLNLPDCAQVVCLFNNKGGVSKTTTTANLAFVLAMESGKNVLLFDADPQCNMTDLFLPKVHEDVKAEPRLNARYDTFSAKGKPIVLENRFQVLEDDTSFIDVLKIGLCGEKFMIDNTNKRGIYQAPPTIYKVRDNCNLYLLPGRSNHEMIQKLLKTVDTTYVHFGALKALFCILKQAYDIDYIFVDVGPSVSEWNRQVVFSCNLILPPLCPDVNSYSSLTALLKKDGVLQNWRLEFENRPKPSLFPSFDMTFPKIGPFLLCNYKLYDERVTEAHSDLGLCFQEYIERSVHAFTETDENRLLCFFERLGSLDQGSDPTCFLVTDKSVIVRSKPKDTDEGVLSTRKREKLYKRFKHLLEDTHLLVFFVNVVKR